MAGNFLGRNGSELKKTFDANIRAELNATKGGRLRKYTDWEVIEGESRVTKTGGQGNYTNTAPNLYGLTNLNSFAGKMSGKTRATELTPQYRYAYEVLAAEQKMSLGFKFKGNEEIFRKLREAIELAEDIEIVTAMEAVDTRLPATNVIGDSTKTIHSPNNIELFKTLLVIADSMYSGASNTMDVGAFMLIDTIDWAKILVCNKSGAIFASSDYQHLTGVDNRRVTKVFGVAIEKCNAFEHPMGDANRTALVESGTVRVCTYNNIIGASWENTLRIESVDSMANNDTFIATVGKSVGAKVLNPIGCWKFSFKAEAANVYVNDELGTETNPIRNQVKA